MSGNSERREPQREISNEEKNGQGQYVQRLADE
jgi:hypothetical protein